MSNEPTIEQMNEVIALFMGGVAVQFRDRYITWGRKDTTPVTELQYHSSWDWLMGVWDKLRIIIWREFDAVYPIAFVAAKRKWVNYCAIVNIKRAHETVYELIQWYNKQQSNDQPHT